MRPVLKELLTHTLWIVGATDSGKSTVAQNLADRHGLFVYHYDKEDAAQVERLAKSLPKVREFLEASLEERWVYPSPKSMFDLLLLEFPHRFPLVIESLLELPRDKPIIVEGFGLLPDLVQSILSSPYQAIWFIPTDKFKWESMVRRGKPSFATTLSDPEKAKKNLLTRDTMPADFYCNEVPSIGLTLHEIDGTCSAEEIIDMVEEHFAKFNTALR